MTLTSFLLGFIVLMGVSIAFVKILDSRAIRVLLMTRETHRQEMEMEKESQKSRQRMLEEIQNPDLVMETIIKMKRGEMVTIPLAAFDYIYRNLNKFTLIDKSGKITIVNQEDYFKFKEKALSLMKSGEEKTLDIEKVMQDIKDREATKPIEIVKHEDGTIVKTDHIARMTEIIKTNGEKVIINHKTDTMTSVNLLEEKETKEDHQTLKEASREKDKKIKALEEENKLNKAKIKEFKEPQKEEAIQSNPIKNKNEENDDEALVNIQEKEFEQEMFYGNEIKTNEIKNNISNTPAWRQGRLSMCNELEVVNKEQAVIECEISYHDKQQALYPFEDLQSFLKEIIHFKENSILMQLCVASNTEQTPNKRKTELNAHTTHNSVISNTDETHNNFNNRENKSITHDDVSINLDLTQLCVIFDERTNCILINVHYFFLKLMSIIKIEDREAFSTLFYKDIEKGFVNNDTLSTIIALINNKASLSIASKLFMQEEKENKNLVNFRPVKVIDTNNCVYQGLYLFMFTNSGFIKKMVNQQEKYIFGTNNIKVTDDEHTGIKITPQLLML